MNVFSCIKRQYADFNHLDLPFSGAVLELQLIAVPGPIFLCSLKHETRWPDRRHCYRYIYQGTALTILLTNNKTLERQVDGVAAVAGT